MSFKMRTVMRLLLLLSIWATSFRLNESSSYKQEDGQEQHGHGLARGCPARPALPSTTCPTHATVARFRLSSLRGSSSWAFPLQPPPNRRLEPPPECARAPSHPELAAAAERSWRSCSVPSGTFMSTESTLRPQERARLHQARPPVQTPRRGAEQTRDVPLLQASTMGSSM